MMPKPEPPPGRAVIAVILMDRLNVPMAFSETLATARFREYLDRTEAQFEIVDATTPSGRERAKQLLGSKVPTNVGSLPILAILDATTGDVLSLALMPKDVAKLISAIKTQARN